MKAKLLNDASQRVYAVIFDIGEDPIAGLTRFAEEQDLSASSLTAIGAFSEALLAYFEWETRAYRDIPVRDQVEVVSLVGDVALGEDGPKVHAHAVLGCRDGTVLGGHLRSARVRPTLELVLQETPRHLVRSHHPESGLALIDPSVTTTTRPRTRG
jgi:hypothetical protein